MTGAPGHQQVDDLLRVAESRLWAEFNSSSIVKHSGDKGEVRVSALRELLDRQLPDRFAVTSGSVIDADGRQTQQQDVLIYDAVDTRPYMTLMASLCSLRKLSSRLSKSSRP